ncbi:MAG TPA: radical SAM protein [Bryobacteraceae bacterium]|nr:radical SAM protein [Bryobacteraceae bacterium]
MPHSIRSAAARSILSKTSGFIAEAGFTHSLTPARNCTFGCTYCYVPTMRIYGGLQPEDWNRWGQFTTFKSNAAELLERELRTEQSIYCSPLVDPYQPAEAEEQMMPRILDALLTAPPRVFAIQTRGPLILRDLDQMRTLSRRTKVRVSFSVTTNREDIRRLYEPHCASFSERLEVVRTLREGGIETYATLAPLLPCDPEVLVRAAIDASRRDLIGDPLHIRSTKRHGATTREAAFRISSIHGYNGFLDAAHQARVVEQIDTIAREAGFTFTTGPRGFARLAL